MKEGYVIRDQAKIHFLTITVVDWIDVFTRKSYKDEIIDSLDYCIKHKRMILYGYVIMSNHLHLIVQSSNGKLSDLVIDFKKFTATSILKKFQSEPESRREWMLERFSKASETHSRNKNFQFWQYGNHAIEVYSKKFMWSKLNYIHLNPVRGGIVNRISDYVYSKALNYVPSEGMLEIELVDHPIVDILGKSDIDSYLVNE